MPWVCRQRRGSGFAHVFCGLWAAALVACSSPSTPSETTPDRTSKGSGGVPGGAGAGAPGSAGGSAQGGVSGTATGSGGISAGPVADAAAQPPPDPTPPADAGSSGPGTGDDGPGTPADPGVGEDLVPDRPLVVDKTPQLYTIHWKPSDADPASMGKNESQTAIVDTTKMLQKKLVIVLAGSNGAPGPIEVVNFAAGLGFHAYAIAYHDEYNASQGVSGPEVFGNSRFNELDGMGRKPAQVQVPRADSVEVRMMKGLAYLQTKNPEGDWSYYLQKNGDIRWSDVIFIGHSHGATSGPAFAKVRRVWRAISLSGPRDDNPVPATWLTMKSLTPIDRYYGFTGTADSQHQDHIKSMELQGYLGTLTPVEGAKPPYGNSHRLRYTGGHGGSANCGNYADVCKYMFGVP